MPLSKLALKNILSIDDSAIDQFILARLLKLAGYQAQLTCYNNAASALSYLNQTASVNPSDLPQLILLDINMPGINGFQFVSELENSYPLVCRYCPIIMISSSCNKEEIARILLHPSIKGFIEKPIDISSLGYTIKMLVRDGFIK